MENAEWGSRGTMAGVAIAVVIAVATALSVVQISERPGIPTVPLPTRAPRAVMAQTVPDVPPAVFIEEAPDLARASNAAVPVANGQLTPAPPFHYQGSAEDRAAALACLSTAILYEAGDDSPGERAVAQVVLNRLRHPAFPKTVCGVIFQGSERKTGCQFTFTCDGSLTRRQPAAALQRATKIAEAALSGYVDKPVGTATHYHADWVVPYWRSSLQKIAIVHTQIFYRWPGTWGSRSALSGRLQPGERPNEAVVRLAGLTERQASPLTAANAALPVPAALAVEGVPQAALRGNIVRLKDESAGQFVVQLDAAAPPASYAIAGYNLCGEKLECTVFGWTDAKDIPRSLPILPWMMQSLAFVYRKSKTLGIAQGYWECRRFPRPLPAQCLVG